ncbi:MAG: endolytic transglycosylase MltG [Gemmatimonadaceae bacterium]
MRRRATLLALLLATALVAGACASDDKTSVTLTIRAGSSFREAAESLAAHDVIGNARLFGWYAARRGKDRNIRYGTYFIRRGGSWDEVLTTLAQGRGIVNRVRITEGWPLWDIIPALAEGLMLAPESLEVAVRDTTLLRRLGVPRSQSTAEGYLFPDTYDFPDGVTARQAVELMVRRFERVWKPEWDERLAELKMTRHQAVTLASIVEKEVRRGEERPVVSAVYTNRLRIGMPLQADPTVQYALKKRPGRVLYRDLRVDSPYNTYRRAGLPPGPIASPGAASLEAALYPAKVPYRFFVAHPNGHHEFRTTYREHLEAIKMVREVARRDTLERRELERKQAADSAAAAKADSIGQ